MQSHHDAASHSVSHHATLFPVQVPHHIKETEDCQTRLGDKTINAQKGYVNIGGNTPIIAEKQEGGFERKEGREGPADNHHMSDSSALARWYVSYTILLGGTCPIQSLTLE